MWETEACQRTQAHILICLKHTHTNQLSVCTEFTDLWKVQRLDPDTSFDL